MTHATHTPGPWKLRRAETVLEHDFILRAGPHTIAWSVPRADRNNTRKKSVHIANARLIAAAPELLEAMKLIANAENSALDLAHCKGIARAAIAKATGGEA